MSGVGPLGGGVAARGIQAVFHVVADPDAVAFVFVSRRVPADDDTADLAAHPQRRRPARRGGGERAEADDVALAVRQGQVCADPLGLFAGLCRIIQPQHNVVYVQVGRAEATDGLRLIQVEPGVAVSGPVIQPEHLVAGAVVLEGPGQQRPKIGRSVGTVSREEADGAATTVGAGRHLGAPDKAVRAG